MNQLISTAAPARRGDDAAARREEHFQRCIDALQEGFWELNATGCTIYVNPFVCRMLGYSTAELLDHSPEDLVHPEDRAAFRQAIARRLRGEAESYEARIRHQNGTYLWLKISAAPVLDSAGQVVGAFAVVSDVTEKKRAEEAIRQLNAELERRVQERTAQLEAINRELEAFCYSVSHDLRAPLRAVRGFSEVLLEQYTAQLDERGQNYLRRTCDASAQMDRLIDDLLKLSRATRGELQNTEIELSAMAGEIAAQLKASEPARSVEFTIAPDLRAKGDERLVRQVLENLIRNAWKFTGPRPRGQIEVGFNNGAEPAFFVRDNGVGFDMEYAGKLFGVFQRLHAASEFPGSGVGLAIVQRIINRHGGKAWARGEIGKGATFYFTLPATGAVS
jgi:PAS domain S-box-containing protein